MKRIEFAKLENAKKRATIQIFEVADDTRVWVVIDIHERVGIITRMDMYNGASANTCFWAADVDAAMASAHAYVNTVFGEVK